MGALTTASATVLLAFGEFRGFAEPGVISSIGIVSTWAAMYGLLPALTAVLAWSARDVRFAVTGKELTVAETEAEARVIHQYFQDNFGKFETVSRYESAFRYVPPAGGLERTLEAIKPLKKALRRMPGKVDDPEPLTVEDLPNHILLRLISIVQKEATIFSLIGWSALLPAAMIGMRRIGQLACVGMIAVTLVSLIVLPAALAVLDRAGWIRPRDRLAPS